MKRPQRSAASRLAGNDCHGAGHTQRENWRLGATPPAHFDFSRTPIPPKLTMGQPGDAQEQEAERAAAAAMGGIAELSAAPARSSKPIVQRCGCGKSEAAIAAPQSVHSGLLSPSQALDPSARRFMEARFGHDFGHVRIHANSEAAEASRSAGAQAYTVGPDIVFGAEQYQPHRRSGRELIAHELTHVLQQRESEPVVRRRMLYPAAPVTDNDNPIPRT